MTLQFACQPFITAGQLRNDPSCSCRFLDDNPLITHVIDAATDLLFMLSDGRVHGVCQRTARPMKTGICGFTEGDLYGTMPATRFGGHDVIPIPGVRPEVTEVLIDGVVLGSAEYRLIDNEFLLRVDGTWPTTNSLTLDSGDVGVFEISWRYGFLDFVTEQAALELACELLTAFTTNRSRLPDGVVSANIQGAAVALRESLDGESDPSAGLDRVRRFYAVHCRDGQPRSGVWSPELTHGWQLVEVEGPAGS